MKISITLLAFLILIIPVHLFSQNLKEGYIINMQHDTVHGFIKENPDEELAKSLSFAKENDNSQLVKYTPAQLTGFGFSNGRIFEKISLKEFNGKDSVEIEYLVKRILTGKIYAYTIESPGKETQWLLKNQVTGKIVHLKKPREHEERKLDGQLVISTDFKYLQYLVLVKQDSPSDFIKQDDFNYSKKQLIKNIKKYNSSYADKFPIHQYKEQTQISYGLLGGAYAFSHHVNQGEAEFKGGYRISGFRDVTWFEKIGRISFTQGFSYSKFKTFTQEYGPNINQEGNSYYLHDQVLSIYPAGVKFSSYGKSITAYIYTGIGMTFIKFSNDPQLSFTDEKTIKVGLNIGTGLKIKITPHLFILAELSQKYAEGFYANGGIAYQYIKQK